MMIYLEEVLLIIPNATSKAYTVDLTTVGSSGEYYCEIQIGATPPGVIQAVATKPQSE